MGGKKVPKQSRKRKWDGTVIKFVIQLQFRNIVGCRFRPAWWFISIIFYRQILESFRPKTTGWGSVVLTKATSLMNLKYPGFIQSEMQEAFDVVKNYSQDNHSNFIITWYDNDSLWVISYELNILKDFFWGLLET